VVNLSVKKLHALGTHLILDFEGCDMEILKDVRKIRMAMITAAKKANATIVKKGFHKFEPFGVSGMIIIAESHLSIHTWPEYCYAAVDIFACGTIDVNAAANCLAKRLKSTRCKKRRLKRGTSKSLRPHKPVT
jgi:S-adenosylmethionine decarboxylase